MGDALVAASTTLPEHLLSARRTTLQRLAEKRLNVFGGASPGNNDLLLIGGIALEGRNFVVGGGGGSGHS